MLKDFETKRKLISKSPALSYSPHFMNLGRARKSISPKRYTANELIEIRKTQISAPINSGTTSKGASVSNQSSEHISRMSLTGRNDVHRKPPTPKISENLLPIRRMSPKALICSKPPTALNAVRSRDSVNIKNFKVKSLYHPTSLKTEETHKNPPKTDENRVRADDLFNLKHSTHKSNPRVPLAPHSLFQKRQTNRSVSAEKRKLPARYLKIDTNPRRPEKTASHVPNDLKILQENNSQSLIRDLEAAKLTRLHQKALRQGSILKNVYEEESWHWSSPESSPAKVRHVHFPND